MLAFSPKSPGLFSRDRSLPSGPVSGPLCPLPSSFCVPRAQKDKMLTSVLCGFSISAYFEFTRLHPTHPRPPLHCPHVIRLPFGLRSCFKNTGISAFQVCRKFCFTDWTIVFSTSPGYPAHTCMSPARNVPKGPISGAEPPPGGLFYSCSSSFSFLLCLELVPVRSRPHFPGVLSCGTLLRVGCGLYCPSGRTSNLPSRHHSQKLGWKWDP